MNTEKMAAEVAEELQKAGFIGTVIIIGQVVSLLYSFLKACHSDSTTARQRLLDAYDAESDTFDRSVMKPTIRQTLKAARKSKQDYSDDDIEQMAKTSLLKVMNQSDDVVTKCYAE